MTQSVVQERQANLLAGNAAAIGNQAQMTAFELKIEVSLHKTFLNMTSSVLSCVLISNQLVKEGKLAKGATSDLVIGYQPGASYNTHHFTH